MPGKADILSDLPSDRCDFRTLFTVEDAGE